MGMKGMGRGLALAPAGALLLLAAPAGAQEGGLGEIVVSAQKREQSLQEVPATIDVVDERFLATWQVQGMSQLALLAPGFEFARAPSDSPGITFRGIGTQAGNVAFDNSIGMFVDGAFLGNVRLYGQTLFDLERIELIKGTQSTLLGKNTSLGAISVVNRRPDREAGFAGEVGGELENGGWFGELAANLPVSDTVAVRLAARYSRLDGWLTNVTTDRQVPIDTDIGVRVSALHEKGPFSALLSYQYTENERWGTANQMTDAGLSGLGLGAGPPLGEADFDKTKASFSSDPRLKGNEDITRLKAHMVTATLSHDVGPAILTSVTNAAWFDFLNNLDFDFNNKDATVLARSEDYSQVSQEFRIASPTGGRLEWLAGAYIFASDWSLTQDNDYGIPDFPPPPDPVSGQLFNGAFTNSFAQETFA